MKGAYRKSRWKDEGKQCRDEGRGQVVVLPTCLQIQWLGICRIGPSQCGAISSTLLLANGFDPAPTVYNKLDRLDDVAPTLCARDQLATQLPSLSSSNHPTTSLILFTVSHDYDLFKIRTAQAEAMTLWRHAIPNIRFALVLPPTLSIRCTLLCICRFAFESGCFVTSAASGHLPLHACLQKKPRPEHGASIATFDLAQLFKSDSIKPGGTLRPSTHASIMSSIPLAGLVGDSIVV